MERTKIDKGRRCIYLRQLFKFPQTFAIRCLDRESLDENSSLREGLLLNYVMFSNQTH